MNFDLSEKQQIAKEIAQSFSKKVLAPEAQKINKEGIVSDEFIKNMGDTNLLGLIIPEPFGGAGLDFSSYVTAIEEVSKMSPSVGVSLTGHSMLSFAVLALGKDTVKRDVLSELSQNSLGAVAVTEPDAGGDMTAIKTFGSEVSQGYRISGNKTFISNAGIAKYFAVLFKNSRQPGPNTYTLGLVKKGASGFSVGKKEETIGLKGDDLRGIVFEECLVEEKNILGEVGNGIQSVQMLGGVGSLGIAAAGLGAAQACLDYCLDYTKQRVSFGAPIAEQQVIQLYIAEMSILVDAARYMLYKAAWGLDNNDRNPLHIWKSRVFCLDAGLKVTQLTQNIFASYGYSEEYPVSTLIKDVQGLQFIYGTQEILKGFIGKLSLGLPLVK